MKLSRGVLKLCLTGITSIGLCLPVQADDEVLYATQGFPEVTLLTLDPDTGTVMSSVPVTNEEALLGGLGYDGIYLWSLDVFNPVTDRTFRIDPVTGAGTMIGNTGVKFNFRAIEVDPVTGILYGNTDSPIGLNLYTLDKSTGAASFLFHLLAPTMDQVTAIAIDSSGTLYATDIIGTGLFRIDLASRQAIHLGNLNLEERPRSVLFQDLAFDQSGQLWGALSIGGVYLIYIHNVTATLRFETDDFFYGIAFSKSNVPPVAVCKNVTVSAGPSCTAEASIDNGSFDPDGDPIKLTQAPAGPYSLGDSLVQLTVEDDQGATDSCEAFVRVMDVTPPAIQQVSTSLSQIWPPNHKMVPVTMNVQSVDNCFPASCRIASVRSNEPVSGLGDGDTTPDWQILTSSMVDLRAERSGRGNGRVYTITVECTDRAGNRSARDTTVSVPHSQRGR